MAAQTPGMTPVTALPLSSPDVTAPALDVVVLAGGGSRRFGSDKLGASLARGSMLEHTVAECAGAGIIVIAGPPRPLAAWAHPPGARVLWRGEEPPGQGPLAGLAAAVGATAAGVIGVLGGDMPLAGRLLPPMLAALLRPTTAGPRPEGVVIETGSSPPPLLWVLHREVLLAQLDRLGSPAGLALRRVLDGLTLATVADPDGFAADVDTDTDLQAARGRVSAAGTSPDRPA